MSAIKAKFESLSQREQYMVMGLGVALVVFAILFCVLSVRKRMAALQASSAELRDSLAIMKRHRKNGIPGQVEVVTLPDESPGLLTYLDSAAARASQNYDDESKMKLPSKKMREPNKDNGVLEEVVTTEARSIPISQAMTFFQELETKSEFVKLKKIVLRRARAGDGSFIHIDIAVSSFSRPKEKSGSEEKEES